MLAPDEWGWTGLVRCPACSRSTQFPAPPDAPKLPPPASGWKEEQSSGHSVSLWILVLAWSALGTGFAFWFREWSPEISIPLALIYFVAGTVVLAIHFLPSFIATNRKHPNAMPIFVVNLLLGWTLVGWTVALAWSLIALDKRRR